MRLKLTAIGGLWSYLHILNEVDQLDRVFSGDFDDLVGLLLAVALERVRLKIDEEEQEEDVLIGIEALLHEAAVVGCFLITIDLLELLDHRVPVDDKVAQVLLVLDEDVEDLALGNPPVEQVQGHCLVLVDPLQELAHQVLAGVFP